MTLPQKTRRGTCNTNFHVVLANAGIQFRGVPTRLDPRVREDDVLRLTKLTPMASRIAGTTFEGDAIRLYFFSGYSTTCT